MKNIVFCLSVLILGFSCQNNNPPAEIKKEVVPETQAIAPVDTAMATNIPPIIRLDTLIDFDSIIKVKVRNKDGIHELSPEKWEAIEYNLQMSIYIYGLLCQRQESALIFTFKDGSEIEGYFCSGHINFKSPRIYGSFRYGNVINFDSL